MFAEKYSVFLAKQSNWQPSADFFWLPYPFKKSTKWVVQITPTKSGWSDRYFHVYSRCN